MPLSLSQLTVGNVYKRGDGAYYILNEPIVILEKVDISSYFKGYFNNDRYYSSNVSEITPNGVFHLSKFIKLNRFELVLFQNFKKRCVEL